MSDVAKKARAAMKAKAQRLGADRPLEKVDSSTFTPPELLNADVKTGMRPISRRAFKKGGKVMGDCAPTRADRAPRKSGGKAAGTVLNVTDDASTAAFMDFAIAQFGSINIVAPCAEGCDFGADIKIGFLHTDKIGRHLQPRVTHQ